jgi:acyl transferase domain-containing protein/SAM-dependent methyltransferase/acyl carrier protein
MLEILNRYAHGMVLVPFVEAIRRHGCLDSFEAAAPLHLREMERRYSANSGYLAVALRMFESLQWLRRTDTGEYVATQKLAESCIFPADVLSLYEFRYDRYLDGTHSELLAPWIERSLSRWGTDHPYLPDYLDGPLLIPLLLALKANSGVTHSESIEEGRRLAALDLDIDRVAADQVSSLFVAKGWAKATSSSRLQLSHAGRFVWERIFITAALAAYKPMFMQSEALLFGRPQRVFEPDAAGHETHLDRTANVVGSGFQHGKYFDALRESLIAIFDNDEYAGQPKYIADTGCGDGTLLRMLYETVREQTQRGRVLDRYPLTLLGVDFNQKALAASSQTLAAYPHLVLAGDIGEPEKIVDAFRSAGIPDVDRILHVRSFLDHDRPYRAPLDGAGVEQWSRVSPDGVHIDRAGQLIAPAQVVQSTVEHLQRWAGVINRHGLLMLEAHSLPAAATGRFLDESESFHFDAYHAMSRQYLLEAKTFLLCAAAAGMTCDPAGWRRFPKHMRFARITLNHLQRRHFSIRLACEEDAAQLSAMQLFWPASARDFSEVHFVMHSGDRLLAAASCAKERPADGSHEPSPQQLRAVCVRPGVPLEALNRLVDFVEQYLSLEDPQFDPAGLQEIRERIAAQTGSRARFGVGVAADVVEAIAKRPFDARHDPQQAELELSEFVFRCIVTQLRDLGMDEESGTTHTLEEIRERLGIAPKYRRYFQSLLRQLELKQWIALRDSRIEILPAIRAHYLGDMGQALASFSESFKARHPAFSAAMEFVLRCLRRYADIVTGKLDAAEAMFAEGGTEVFGAIFRGEPASDYLNHLVTEALAAHVSRQQLAEENGHEQSPVRILELGAGSGATSRAILEQVVERFVGIQFCISDISPSFVRHAQRQFEERFPGLEYRTIDIGRDVSAQNVELHSYDAIVAGNVLHDTGDIVNTLRQAVRLLKPGGLLVLNEYTEIKRWHFGGGALLHGMWSFEDPQRRLEQFCLLSVQQWKQALRDAGFDSVAAFCLPTQNVDERCGQAVIIAEAVDVTETPVRGANSVVTARPVSTQDSDAPAAQHAQAPITSEQRIAAVVQHVIISILGENRAAQLTATRPLMEMGLDSVELVELKGLLAGHFRIKLTPTFLFDHETPEKIARVLQAMLSEAQIEAGFAQVPLQSASAVDVASYPADTPAVVGIACRFPGGADTPESFWKLLMSRRSAIGSLRERFEWPAFVDMSGAHRSIDRAGCLPRIDEFDPAFFRISPKEAELMDPQQRMLLELSWQALEDAGCAPDSLAGRNVGVFIGACHSDYRELLAATDSAEAYVGSGGAQSILANRLSYFFDLTGPSETIDTACSSSLVALHRGAQAIKSGDCEMSLVGAVNLICTATDSLAYYEAGMLSRSGECRAFDAEADGFVRGEGGALLLLKPLHRAIEAGDSIYGLIIGSAVNHGGQASSLTAPKPSAQASVIERAIRTAGIDCTTLQYIEAHGTGTKLGDPVEIGGLTEAFRRLRGDSSPSSVMPGGCRVGSVKPTLGHLEAAAGLAGLIKVLLAFQHRRFPGMLNFNRLNPQIELADSSFRVVREDEPWEPVHDATGRRIPRRAGVSSFGFGGSNAHVILDEWDPPPQDSSHAGAAKAHPTGAHAPPSATQDDGPCVVVFSAKNSLQLSDTLRQFLSEIDRLSAASNGFSLHDVAYTLQLGRQSMRERVTFVVSDWRELAAAIQDRLTSQQSWRPAGDASRAELSALASRWMRGMDVDWERLHTGMRRRRVHLPTYPFARERYWVPESTRASKSARSANSPERKLDADLPTHSARLYGINWRAVSAAVSSGSSVPSRLGSRMLLLIGSSGEMGERLNSRPGVVCHLLRTDRPAAFGQLQHLALQALEHLQTLARSHPQQPVLAQLVTLVPGAPPAALGLSGLLESLAKELPDIRTQAISIDTQGMSVADWVSRLDECARMASAEFRCVGGTSFVKEWVELDGGAGADERAGAGPGERSGTGAASRPWMSGGVYLITGGAGGLGLLLAREIAQSVAAPIVLLVGRSPAAAAVRGELERLAHLGAHVEYRQADVSDPVAVTSLIGQVLEEHGKLNGVIHAAGVLRDGSLLQKASGDFAQVLHPKMGGLINLDVATADLPLDLFLAFSSICAVFGNAGQSDYATANSMMDRYMQQRYERVAAGQRSGRTLSINWPLWSEGGMRVEGPVLEAMSRGLGMRPMPTRAGMDALYRAIASDRAQVLVMFGDEETIERAVLGSQRPSQQGMRPDVATRVSPEELLRFVEDRSSAIACELLKQRPERLERSQPFSEVGFDSIGLMRFANRLSSEFGLDLTPPIFYRYSTIQSLAQHLCDGYAATLQRKAPARGSLPQGNAPRALKVTEAGSSAPGPRGSQKTPEPIAIVGMSGRFPGAPDIDALWKLLISSGTAIREIPTQRWNWRDVYGDPAAEGSHTDVKWGGFIDGMDEFDPLFFNISPREARGMDPQQRLIMTYAWKLIEEAGYAASSLSGTNTGVFVACGSAEYAQLVSRSGMPIESASAIGCVPSAGPNRVSHLLDLRGPSEPVETGCSSSLVAVYRGMRAIHNGDCEMAIVGGVNTILTPDLHIGLAKAGALSKDGRCKTFSADANGYVRSEGVAFLLLKPLSAAQRDGDHIHGLLVGGAVNHGGRANSLTAPNPRAQAAVIRKAWAWGDIDPSTISYIEAHGTGTVLGDPIEVEGLELAFRQPPGADGHDGAAIRCGIGSIKSNIGHLEMAAGVTGLIKVLLQMKHATLVKSLHCENLNPYIRLQDEHLYIVRENQPWARVADRNGKVLPLRAGVSSFGITGTNAHVVVEQYVTSTAPEAASRGGMTPILLSARDEARLKEQAEALLAALASGRIVTGELEDLAYTLQVGRDSMDERLAILTTSLDDLRVELAAYLTHPAVAGNIYRGQARNSSDTFAILTRDAKFQEAVDSWIENGELAKLAELWVKGMSVDWRKLHRSRGPRRLSLPGHPLKGARYWVGQNTPATRVAASREHALIRKAADEGAVKRFSVSLSGEESFFVDHVVRGQRTLPAVVYLELVRAATQQAASDEQCSIWMEGVTWAQPLFSTDAVSGPKIELRPLTDGSFEFDVSSAEVLYAQGRTSRYDAVEIPSVELAPIRARCIRAKYAATAVYAAFSSLGIEYGPTHRVLDSVEVGDHEVVAKLAALTDEVTDSTLGIHPGIADGALQATIGFSMAEAGANCGTLQVGLPFEMERVEIFASCVSAEWIVVRRHGDAAERGDTRRYNLDVCDGQGRSLLRIQGMVTRALRQQTKPSRRLAATTPSEAEGEKTRLLATRWAVLKSVGAANADAAAAERVVILTGTITEAAATSAAASFGRVLEMPAGAAVDAIQARLASCGTIDHLVWVLPPSAGPACSIDESVVSSQASGTVFGFRLVKALIAAGYDSRSLRVSVVTSGAVAVGDSESVDPTHAGVHGLMGVVANEMSGWDVRICDVSVGAPLPWSELLVQWSTPSGSVLALRSKCWFARQLVDYEPLHGGTERIPTRPDGVYVIIGGAGGIGEAWTQWLLRRHSVRIVWIGRRPLSESISIKLDRLAQFGPRPLYICADASREEELQRAIQSVRAEIGAIHGVVHSAIELTDCLLGEMTEAQFVTGLTAKIHVGVRMAQVFSQDALDFALFFSSFNSYVQLPGTANYTAGCAFEDALGIRLATQWSCPVRVINWGFWGNVGATSAEHYRVRMAKVGLLPLDTSSAFGVIDTILTNDVVQLSYIRTTSSSAIEGDRLLVMSDRPREGAASARPTERGSAAGAVSLQLVGKTREDALALLNEYLRDKSADILGVHATELALADRPFSQTLLGEFGMDSLSATNLRNVLRRELQIDIPVRLVISEPAGRLAENIYEQVLLLHLSSARPLDVSVESESFVI